MRIGFPVFSGRTNTLLNSLFAGAFALVLFVMASSTSSQAIPAFARKYGLPCSACHETWPKLNIFGQTFKDNGYQLMNDRDSPIWQNPSYWPVTFRITPNWHRESTNRVSIDTAAGQNTGITKLTQHGFDLSGLDILTGGTLYNNISFLLTPSSDETGAFHFESAWVRFDNLAKSPWLNLRFGKFELDNIISEKREETLSANGATYWAYHYEPFGDNNMFAQIGDNQLGFELGGHSVNDRTRYSVAVFSSNDGNVDLQFGNSYSTYITVSQAFNAGYRGGVDRVGAYYYGGEAPVVYLAQGGAPLAGSGRVNKGFNREGLFGIFYANKLDFSLQYQHASDNAYFGTSTVGDNVTGLPPLPAGARSPVWNDFFVETHWVQNPQLIFIQRSEFVRMSQQAVPGVPSNLGNLDNYVFGVRYYPFMFSRAGMALHGEYSLLKLYGEAPAPDLGLNLTTSSVLLGIDFDF